MGTGDDGLKWASRATLWCCWPIEIAEAELVDLGAGKFPAKVPRLTPDRESLTLLSAQGRNNPSFNDRW